MHEGDLDRAGRLHEECLELSRQQGDGWSMGIVLFDLALLPVGQQQYAEARRCRRPTLRAARLRGAMEGLLKSVGAPPQATYHTWIGDRSLEIMKLSLGDGDVEAAVAEGRSMSSQALEPAM